MLNRPDRPIIQNLPFGSFDRDAPAIENDTTKSCAISCAFSCQIFSFFELIFKINWIGSKKMKQTRYNFQKIWMSHYLFAHFWFASLSKQENLFSTNLMKNSWLLDFQLSQSVWTIRQKRTFENCERFRSKKTYLIINLVAVIMMFFIRLLSF